MARKAVLHENKRKMEPKIKRKAWGQNKKIVCIMLPFYTHYFFILISLFLFIFSGMSGFDRLSNAV